MSSIQSNTAYPYQYRGDVTPPIGNISMSLYRAMTLEYPRGSGKLPAQIVTEGLKDR
jgi:hypothetical protein